MHGTMNVKFWKTIPQYAGSETFRTDKEHILIIPHSVGSNTVTSKIYFNQAL